MPQHGSERGTGHQAQVSAWTAWALLLRIGAAPGPAHAEGGKAEHGKDSAEEGVEGEDGPDLHKGQGVVLFSISLKQRSHPTKKRYW